MYNAVGVRDGIITDNEGTKLIMEVNCIKLSKCRKQAVTAEIK